MDLRGRKMQQGEVKGRKGVGDLAQQRSEIGWIPVKKDKEPKYSLCQRTTLAALWGGCLFPLEALERIGALAPSSPASACFPSSSAPCTRASLIRPVLLVRHVFAVCAICRCCPC